MFDSFTKLIKKAIEIPKNGVDLLLDQHESSTYEKNNHIDWEKLSFSPQILQKIEQQLHSNQSSTIALNQFDQEIVSTIQAKTEKLNRNNVTRTKAYLDFYNNHPEVHWALLAHLVSRNGGWNMTDLKGSILPNILTSEAIHDFFSFLERANALIFHDAFPQLLLYEASKQKGKNLFYLLPKFHVSKFMRSFWDEFFLKKDSQLITVALIINEQNYIENRVVKHPAYKEKVLDNILFKIQEWLQFTYVLFPYSITSKKIRLAGVTVSDFANVAHRIEIGKKLYLMLFGNKNLFKDIKIFAQNTPHTGSRSDYWPLMFTQHTKELLLGISLSCKPKKPGVLSPSLTKVWSDVSHSFLDKSDWFSKNNDITSYFHEISISNGFDLSRQYCQDVNKMIVASSAIDIIK